MEFKNVEIKTDLVKMSNTVHYRFLCGNRLYNTYCLFSAWVSGSIVSASLILFSDLLASVLYTLSIASICVMVVLCFVIALILTKIGIFLLCMNVQNDDIFNAAKRRDVIKYVKSFKTIDTVEQARKFIYSLPFTCEEVEDYKIWFKLSECQFFLGATDGAIIVKLNNNRIVWDLTNYPDYNITKSNIDRHKLLFEEDGDISVISILDAVEEA